MSKEEIKTLRTKMKHWRFLGLGIAFMIDLLVILFTPILTAWSIGWLIAMILDYKDIREEFYN